MVNFLIRKTRRETFFTTFPIVVGFVTADDNWTPATTTDQRSFSCFSQTGQFSPKMERKVMLKSTRTLTLIQIQKINLDFKCNLPISSRIKLIHLLFCIITYVTVTTVFINCHPPRPPPLQLPKQRSKCQNFILRCFV